MWQIFMKNRTYIKKFGAMDTGRRKKAQHPAGFEPMNSCLWCIHCLMGRSDKIILLHHSAQNNFGSLYFLFSFSSTTQVVTKFGTLAKKNLVGLILICLRHIMPDFTKPNLGPVVWWWLAELVLTERS